MAETELSREQLVGCWRIVAPGGSYIELRDDGTARRKDSWKGVSADFTCQIFWRQIDSSGLELAYHHSGESEPHIVEEFRVKYLMGKRLEWWRVRLNERVTQNVMHSEPVCWTRTRPPKSWQE